MPMIVDTMKKKLAPYKSIANHVQYTLKKPPFVITKMEHT